MARELHPDTVKLMRMLLCRADEIPERFAAWQEERRRGCGKQLPLIEGDFEDKPDGPPV